MGAVVEKFLFPIFYWAWHIVHWCQQHSTMTALHHWCQQLWFQHTIDVKFSFCRSLNRILPQLLLWSILKIYISIFESGCIILRGVVFFWEFCRLYRILTLNFDRSSKNWLGCELKELPCPIRTGCRTGWRKTRCTTLQAYGWQIMAPPKVPKCVQRQCAQ